MTDGFRMPLNPHPINYFGHSVEEPKKTDQEIQDLIDTLRPDLEIPAEMRGQKGPDALVYDLYPHQELALTWMSAMEAGPNKGGILADDMGLGKTVSIIALMAARLPYDEVRTNLIVGPVALIKQWADEIARKLKPGYPIKVCLLHGKKMGFDEIKMYDVVLTTYGTLSQEWKRYDQHLADRRDCPDYEPANDKELHEKCPIIHPESKYFRVILDESQYIKNRNTQSSKAVSMIWATYRWCLTGTPMMNSVSELFPLIRFLQMRPYGEYKYFQRVRSSLFPLFFFFFAQNPLLNYSSTTSLKKKFRAFVIHFS